MPAVILRKVMNMFPTSLVRMLMQGIRSPMSMPWIIYQTILNLFKMVPTNELETKIILITGASSGLGEALSHICYELGSQVILCGRKAEELQRVKRDLVQKQINHISYEPIILVMDLVQLSEIDGKVTKLLELCGHIDILINNAGIGFRGDVCSTAIETDIKVMVTNYFGQIALTKAILPYMKAQGSGTIVAISSIQGRIAIPNRSSYAASKHAVQAFFDCLRSEVSKDGINVCVVSPGYIRTNLSSRALTGSGETYGITDPTTASGMDPKVAAFEIVKTVITNKKEVILAPLSNKIALYLRTVFPSSFFYIMARRANIKETNAPEIDDSNKNS